MFTGTAVTVNRRPRSWSTIGGFFTSAAGLAGTLVPALCCLCGRDARPAHIDLCAHCAACLPRLPPEGLRARSGATLIVAPLIYEEPVDYMVRALKFRGERVYARVLGALLAGLRDALAQPLPDLVIPVPLHRRRFVERGFNQADEIARCAAGLLGLPLSRRALARTRHTAEQSGLPAASRRQNLAGAFAAGAQLTGLRVALVDDVLTTGSTTTAATTALQAAGVASVEIWVAARVQERSANSNTRPANTVMPK